MHVLITVSGSGKTVTVAY